MKRQEIDHILVKMLDSHREVSDLNFTVGKPMQVESAGELVPVGQTLVKLVDLAEVKATFYLPNAELAAAKIGAKATVVADAWPSDRFEGVVRTVAAQAEFTPRNIQTRTDRDRLVYPVEVWIANSEGKLRPGMPVQVLLQGAR